MLIRNFAHFGIIQVLPFPSFVYSLARVLFNLFILLLICRLWKFNPPNRAKAHWSLSLINYAHESNNYLSFAGCFLSDAWFECEFFEKVWTCLIVFSRLFKSNCCAEKKSFFTLFLYHSFKKSKKSFKTRLKLLICSENSFWSRPPGTCLRLHKNSEHMRCNLSSNASRNYAAFKFWKTTIWVILKHYVGI